MVWLGYIELKWYSHRVSDFFPNIVLNFGLFAPCFYPWPPLKSLIGGVEVNGPILSEGIVQILDFNKYKVSLNKL